MVGPETLNLGILVRIQAWQPPYVKSGDGDAKINMEPLEKQKQPILPEGYSYHPEGYLWCTLPIEKFKTLPETVDVEGQSFGKKSEFHVTVANTRSIARYIAGSDIDAVAGTEIALQKLLAEYVNEAPITFGHFIDDLRLAISSDRASIAARCTAQNLEGYFERIKVRYGKEFPLQPAHVSIYTKTGAAVGIDSTEQMESFKKLDLPKVQEVLNRISF